MSLQNLIPSVIENRIGRRNFLCMAGAAVAIGLSFVFGDQEGELPYHIVNNSDHHISRDTLQRIADNSIPALRQYLDDLTQQYGTPSRITQSVNDLEEDQTLLESRVEANRLIQDVRPQLSDALNFWSSDRLAQPDVNYNVPLTADEVISSSKSSFALDNQIDVNVLGSVGILYLTTIELDYDGDIVDMYLNISDSGLGNSNRIHDVSQSEGSIKISSRRSPISWAIEGQDEFSLYETLPHEVLHNQISVWTEHHLSKYLTELASNVSVTDLESEFRSIETEFVLYEEILVDCISTAWLIDYSEREGLDLTPKFVVPETERMVEVVGRIGPQKLIEIYADKGPKHFYEEVVQKA
jgi:hypothetical protein